MDRLIHTAAHAMRGSMARQTATAHNLANASTTGFRADMAVADARYVNGTGFDSRVLPREGVKAANLSSGTVTATGRPLDVAMRGDALLAVQGAGGDEAYTRRGDLSVSDSGFLQTGDGHLVLGDGGPIAIPPADAITIADDGSISIVPTGGDPAAPVPAGQLKLASAAGSDVVKGLDGLLTVRGGGVLPPDAAARVTPGHLEGSNVNATAALVEMIAASRAYEVNVKLVSTAEQIDQAGTRLMSLPG